MAARAYKHEEVAKTPAGYRVRSVKRGTHVVRVAFPPGARRKGTGKVVEILHPKSETNPSCIVSNQVRSNPGELLIFGNPSKNQSAFREVLKEGSRQVVIARDAEGAYFNVYPYVNYGETMVKSLGKWTKLETARAKARKWLAGGGRNPSTQAAKRVTRERAARIRGARLNSVVWGNPKGKGVAKLTPEEDRVWVRAFEDAINDGKTDLQADRWAAKEVQKQFPRLKKFRKFAPNPWHPAGNFHSRAEADTRKRQLEAAGHTVMMVVSARGTKAENYSVLTRKPVTNPKRATKRRRRTDRKNPDETRAAVRLFEKFHGRDPKDITEKHVSAAMRKDYTALGDLEHLKVITPLGQTVQFYFEGDGVKLASSPDGKQLYCIGGNQNLTGCLDKDSLEKDFVDLGECIQVQYLARKVHANFEPVSYYHKFGEKTGARPQLAYNKLQKQIYFVGGEYFIDTKQGVSPGIEN